MNPLLEQFLSETREALQGISEKLLQLERDPESGQLITELFRLVHTLKGNSGLFDFPELTRVLHAGEDLMDSVREGRLAYSPQLADQLLDAMDFVGMLCDEIENGGSYDPGHAPDSVRLAEQLRRALGTAAAPANAPSLSRGGEGWGWGETATAPAAPAADPELAAVLNRLPQEVRAEACRLAAEGSPLHLVLYRPAEECFFQGDDPFYQSRLTPGILWGGITAREEWPPLAELDAYRCVLDFQMLASAQLDELREYFRYMAEQVRLLPVTVADLAAAESGEAEANPPCPPFAKGGTFGEGAQVGGEACPGVPPSLSAELRQAAADILAVQREILSLPDDVAWVSGRLQAAAAALKGCLRAAGAGAEPAGLAEATSAALEQLSAAPLAAWFEASAGAWQGALQAAPQAEPLAQEATAPAAAVAAAATPAEGTVKFGRRAEDAIYGPKSVRVDQAKIDRLMNLIGEMVVAKNALPYLAARAEAVFGVRELSREIKAQYAVINRIAEEMQDSIMQVRMMPVSFVFQRFPRLVRDTAQKLGKKVHLVLEGEETEADKNVIEALADPLVHIVRNSLDHGIESPEERQAQGKPESGTLVIKAVQESDRVVIEIRDDGKGIDPELIRRKALEKGIIDAERSERITDQEAVNLVFAPGFSTADKVSDLSGRGVGMDVVKNAIENLNGSVTLESGRGKGTRIRISLPLSLAVSNVMIIESSGRSFGVPMDAVVETVRIPRGDIKTIKRCMATVLRGRIVPLKSLNALLGLATPQKANDEDELAVLVVNLGDGPVGLVIDDFHETVDIILKPLAGILSGLPAYAGSALLGDGSVLLVLNLKEVL